MAKSESRSALVGRLKAYVAQKLSHEFVDLEALGKVISQTRGAPDRMAALVLSLLVEDGLRVALARLLPLASTNLFADRGLLSTFDAKILIAVALGLVDDRSRSDLDLIREVRNAAAHGIFEFSFSEQAVSDVCLLIVAKKEMKISALESGPIPSQPRQRFSFGCIYYYNAFINKEAVKPISPESHAWW